VGVQLGDIVDAGNIQQMTTQLKMISTIYQYNKRINLIGNFHNFILKFKNPS
jgi:hypothetical protein